MHVHSPSILNIALRMNAHIKNEANTTFHIYMHTHERMCIIVTIHKKQHKYRGKPHINGNMHIRVQW